MLLPVALEAVGFDIAVTERHQLMRRNPVDLTATAATLEAEWPDVPIMRGYARALRIVAADLIDHRDLP